LLYILALDGDFSLVAAVSMTTEKAFGDDGCLRQPKELSINKVGHG
jgi:hypothetical protein